MRDKNGIKGISLAVSSDKASVIIGGSGGGNAGYLNLRDNAGHESINLDGASGKISLNNVSGLPSTITLDGKNGDIVSNDNKGKHSFSLGKSDDYIGLWIGASESEGGEKPGKMFLRDASGKDSITLDGSSGDILLSSADCAEDFDISESAEIEPGTVMVIEEEGKLRPSCEAYDKRVAGVISGAGDSKPGIILDKKDSSENRKPVALMGKVYCKVEAKHLPIEIGDLLTTSSISGHAMKATDPLRAFGAVIGKALQSMKSGKGLIPILISLQ